ncbi:MAG: hypothetical protein JNL74_01570 [Fibrobacteres bacterium]|nr:hypothetical protein [Fibrobacterota bacterium]
MKIFILILISSLFYTSCEKRQNPNSLDSAYSYQYNFVLSQKMITVNITSSSIKRDTTVYNLDSLAQVLDTTSKYLFYFTELDFTRIIPVVKWQSLSCYLPESNLCKFYTLPGYIDSTYFLISKDENDSSISLAAYDTMSVIRQYIIKSKGTSKDTFWFADSVFGRSNSSIDFDHVNVVMYDSLRVWAADTSIKLSFYKSGIEKDNDTLKSSTLYKSNGVLYNMQNYLVELGSSAIKTLNPAPIESVINIYSHPDTISKYHNIKISTMYNYYNVNNK